MIDRFGDVLSAQYERIDTSEVPRYTRTLDHRVFGQVDASRKSPFKKSSHSSNLSDLSQRGKFHDGSRKVGNRAAELKGADYIALPDDDSDSSEPFTITPR